MIPKADRLMYHENIDFTPRAGSVVIIDESDDYVLTTPSTFMKFSRKAPCICLTATCSDSQDVGLERTVLENMEFKIFEDLYDQEPGLDDELQFERLKVQSHEDVIQYLVQERTKMAAFIYCTPEFKEHLDGASIQYTYIDESINTSALRSLDDCIDGQYSLVVGDSAQIALRGLDLRSYNVGILFLTMRSF